MRIIGIDPGTYKTGFGIIDEHRSAVKYIASGCLESRAKLVSVRYEEIYKQLIAVLDEYKPDICSIESPFMYQNPKVAMRLGEIRGVLILSAIQFKLETVEYSPLEVKKSVVGYGRADKSQVRKMVMALLNLKSLSGVTDISDALALALCHVHNKKSIRQYMIKKL